MGSSSSLVVAGALVAVVLAAIAADHAAIAYPTYMG